MPDNQQFDVNAARKAGYSDDEILTHLTSTRAFDVQGAIKAGYSKADIIGHLSTSAPQGPSADQLAAGALSKQGLGPAESPGTPAVPSKLGGTGGYTPEDPGSLPDILGQMSPEQKANYAQGAAMPAYSGLVSMKEGGQQYASSFNDPDYARAAGTRYKAGTNVIGGAMEAASPLLPGAIAAAPLQTLAALGVAGGAGYGARKATEAAGGTPEAQEFAQTAAMAAPYGIGISASRRGGVMSAFGGKVQAGVEASPEAFRGAVKVGDTRIGAEVPRTVEPVAKAPEILPPAPKAKPTEPTATPIGNIQHPEATAPEENIGQFSEKTISNFKKQQLRAMQEGDTAASDALAGMLDADATKKAETTPPTERRLIRRSDSSQMVLDQLHTELRATKDQGERAQLQAAIDRETDLGNRDAIAKETSQTEQPSQSTQAEPRTTPKASRDIEGEVPTQGASQPISEQAPAFTAEQIEHRNNFLKYQDEYARIQAALDKGSSAEAKGFDRGAMNDAQVAWHQAELARLERKMGDSLRNYARVSPPEHIDQMRAGLVQGLQNTKGTAERLSKLIQTDKAAKQLRRMLPELPPAQKQAGRKLLGDIPDTTQYALKQAKFYSPKLKPRVDEAHREIGSTLSSLVQQYGEGNPVATKYAVAFKEGLKGDALTEQHVKNILSIVPAQAKGEIGKLLNILKNETPVVLYHPSIRGTASSALPEVNLRNLRQLLGKQVSSKNPQLTPEQRTDMKVLSATDPQSGKLERENQSRGLVDNLQKQADKRANFLQKQLGVIDKASGAGKRTNEKILADLISKHRTLKEIQTHELESLVADTETLHKVFPQMNMMQQAKTDLQRELDKRNDVVRQQQEILKFKVGQVLQPAPKPQVIAPVSSQLPGARYFADEWYQTPELAAAASVMDSKISKMSASVIGKYLGPLAKKVARGDKQSVALLNAYNKRLVELGKPEALPETLLEKQAKNITNPQEAPIGPKVGQEATFRLPSGNYVSGIIESVIDNSVKIVREDGRKSVLSLEWMLQGKPASTPPLIESKPIEAQKTERVEAPSPVDASRQQVVSDFKKGDLYQKMEVMSNFLDALTRGTDPELRKLVPELRANLGSSIDVVQALAKRGLKKAQDISDLYEATISKSMEATVQDVATTNLEKVINPAPANPTGASMVGGNVSSTPSPSKQLAINSLAKLQDADLAELAPKLIDWAKQRPDLSPEGRHELIAKMVDAALAVPKEKANKTAYDLSRLNAPPMSTWTAETGGEKARVAQQKGYTFAPATGKDFRGTYATHDILDPSGKKVGEATISFIGDTAYIHDIGNAGDGTPEHFDSAAYSMELVNKLGTGAMKQLVRSLQLEHPEITKIAGERGTGAGPAGRETVIKIPSVKSVQDIGKIVQPKTPDPVPESPKLPSPELEKAKARAVETMQAIEKQAGDLGINRLRAIAKGLDVPMPGKIYALDKALTLYLDGLKVGDPNALARARDFLLAQNGEPNTGKMSLFGLDRVVNFLTSSQKIQIPVPSVRLENIRKAQAAELQGPSLVDKLRSIPYTVLTKMYDQFQYLDQNPTRFEKWFAPELIKNFEKRTGIREIRIDTNPWKQARLAYGGGGGVVHAAAIELSRVAKEAGDRGLLDNLKAYLNLVAYDRAIRNIRGKATVALAEAKRLRANADQLEAHIQLGAEPPTRYTEVTSLRKQARQHKEDAKMFAKKLVRKEVVPESYTQASIAQDLRLLQTDLGPSDFSKVEGWANRIYAQLKMSWDDLHQAGMISGQVHQRGELLGRGYIPLARILEIFQDVNRTYGTSSMNVRTRKALQELEGSKLYNVDPIDAALNQIQLASREAQKNLVAKSVLNLAHMDPTGYGQAIKIPQAGYKLAATEGTMVHWDDGEKYTYVVPRFLASVIENATPAGSAVVGAGLLRATAGMFRLGATLANLRFSIPNATRDIQDYASLSKTGMIIKGVLQPFELGRIVKDWTVTMDSTLKQDDWYLRMSRARANFATIQRNISVHPEMLRVGALRAHGVNPFAKAISTVEQFNDVVENNTKLTAFKRNFQLITGGREGPLTKAQEDTIADETRNYGGSPDFASKGTMSAAINLLWMFFNAKIQGTGRTVRRMLEPRRAAMLLGTYTMMGLALMSHNLEIMAPENDGTFEYQHIPNTDKQNYYIILTPGTYQTSTGGVRHSYYKVSKGHLGQLISNPIEDAIEAYAIGHVSISQTALDFAGNLLPGQFNFREGKLAEGAVSGAISSWNPLIKEPIDQARNVDSFKNIPIEPRGMENLENPERYDPNTSLTTRRLSRVIYDNSGKESGAAKMPILGPVLTSPMRMQHAVSGFGAGVADDALRISDWTLGQDRNPKVPLEGTEALAHTPVVGGVISRFVGSPLDQIEKDLETEFYSAADKARVQEGTLNHLAKTSPPEAKAYLKQNIGTLRMSKDILKLEQEMGKLRNYQKQVLANNKLDAGQKRQYIQKLHETRMKLLKFFHEKLAPKFVTN